MLKDNAEQVILDPGNLVIHNSIEFTYLENLLNIYISNTKPLM